MRKEMSKKIALLSIFALCVFAAGCNNNADNENQCVDGENCVDTVMTGDAEIVDEETVDVETGDVEVLDEITFDDEEAVVEISDTTVEETTTEESDVVAE